MQLLSGHALDIVLPAFIPMAAVLTVPILLTTVGVIHSVSRAVREHYYSEWPIGMSTRIIHRFLASDVPALYVKAIWNSCSIWVLVDADDIVDQIIESHQNGVPVEWVRVMLSKDLQNGLSEALSDDLRALTGQNVERDDT